MLSSLRTFARSRPGAVLTVAAIAAVIFAATGWVGWVIIAAILTMVMAHELCHYVVGRRFGAAAPEVAIGFGPVAAQWSTAATSWQLRAFPLGGFVKFSETDTAHGRALSSLSPMRRAAVAAAGPLGSFAAGFIVVLFALMAVGAPRLTATVEQSTGPLQVGDRIVAVDGTTTDDGGLLYAAAASGGAPVPVTVDRNGQMVNVVVADANATLVALGTDTVRMGPLDATVAAGRVLTSTLSLAATGLANFPKVVAGVATNDDTAPQPVGFMEMTRNGGDGMAAFGLFGLLWFAAVISIAVGLFNLLPIPPLDGGHVLLSVYEAVASRIAGHPVVAPDFLVRAITAVAVGGIVLITGLALAADVGVV